MRRMKRQVQKSGAVQKERFQNLLKNQKRRFRMENVGVKVDFPADKIKMKVRQGEITLAHKIVLDCRCGHMEKVPLYKLMLGPDGMAYMFGFLDWTCPDCGIEWQIDMDKAQYVE